MKILRKLKNNQRKFDDDEISFSSFFVIVEFLLNVLKFSLTKQVAYFLKISIQIRQKICSLAAKAATRAKAMAEAKVEANVFKDSFVFA